MTSTKFVNLKFQINFKFSENSFTFCDCKGQVFIWNRARPVRGHLFCTSPLNSAVCLPPNLQNSRMASTLKFRKPRRSNCRCNPIMITVPNLRSSWVVRIIIGQRIVEMDRPICLATTASANIVDLDRRRTEGIIRWQGRRLWLLCRATAKITGARADMSTLFRVL